MNVALAPRAPALTAPPKARDSAPGRYKVTAIANVGGSAQQLETQLASFVHSVSIDPNSYLLTLNTEIGPIALSAVRQVI